MSVCGGGGRIDRLDDGCGVVNEIAVIGDETAFSVGISVAVEIEHYARDLLGIEFFRYIGDGWAVAVSGISVQEKHDGFHGGSGGPVGSHVDFLTAGISDVFEGIRQIRVMGIEFTCDIGIC